MKVLKKQGRNGNDNTPDKNLNNPSAKYVSLFEQMTS